MKNDFIDELTDRHHANDGGFCRHYMTLYSVILGMEAKNVLEFGSGFSSKTILNALCQTDGRLTTLDLRPFRKTSHQYKFTDDEEAKYSPRWRYIQGQSDITRNKVSDQLFDVVLHDGAHEWNYVKEELDFIIPRVKNGGMILVHDTTHPTLNYNLDKSIDHLKKDHEVVTLPYGYGLTIIRVKNDNESIKLNWRKK